MKKRDKPSIANRQPPIIIVGGGLVGLSQAVAIARMNLEVIVIDQEDYQTQTLPQFDGRVSAIAWKSYKFLDEIGVWKNMEKYAEPILDIRVSDNKSSLFLHFDHSEIGDEPFGYIVENRYTRIALISAAKEFKNLKIIAPAKISNVDFENQILEIEQKNKSAITISYSLLIGADGKNSQIRKLSGLGEQRHDYGQHGIVCTIEHEKPHHGLAHENFLPVGPFAVLPMRGNFSSLVWTEPSSLVEAYMKMSEADLLIEIKKRVNYLGNIKLASERFCYKLELMHALRYSGRGFLLVGDAAHAIHPIAGQGVNLGFRDIITLTGLITNAVKIGVPFGSHYVTSEYENIRKRDNQPMIFATDALTKLFSNNIFPIRLARDLGLGIVNQIPPLRRFFMRYAAGKI